MRNLDIRTIVAQVVGLIISCIIITLAVFAIIGNNTDKEAVLAAKNTAIQYTLLRSYYTKHIIGKLTSNDRLTASSDHKNNPDAIPLPATMIHDISELTQSSGLQITLYSEFPFPNRSSRQLDSFQTQAWRQLDLNPDQPYIQTEKAGENTFIRVGIADTMSEVECVNCHNSHPDTPKVNWKLGDVRGVLEVRIPIDDRLEWAQRISNQIVVILVLSFLGLTAAFSVIFNRLIKRKLRDSMLLTDNQKLAMDAHSLVSMTDLRGTITFVNNKFIEISGYSKAELIGQNHRLLNSNNHSKSYWRDMYLTISQGNIWHDQVRNTAKDGLHYWVDTTIVPNFDEDNNLKGYTSIRTDITSEK